MKVTVDGKEVELEAGATLQDALTAANAVPSPGTVVGIVKGRSEMASETNSYWVNTSKGKLRIELLDIDIQSVWHDCLSKAHEGSCKELWTNASATSFGYFKSSFSPSRETFDYNRWEVILGAAGFEPDKTALIFVKKRHTGVYGVPSLNRGVFARIVGGKGTLDRLDDNDVIESIEPIVKWEKLTDKLTTDDMSMPLQEAMEIYTLFEVDLNESAPQGAESFLAATNRNVFEIGSVSSSYVLSELLHGEPIVYEHREPRLEGAVTVRTAGRGFGNIFIYKEDRTSNQYHSVVGRVTSGMELIKLANPGHHLTVKANPERFMLMGNKLSEALEFSSSRGVEAIVDGYTGEDAVVVEQRPATTMEVLKDKKVIFKAIPAGRLVSIQLYDDAAPKSVDYFRHVIGLKERPVGPLPVFFVYENTVLFKPIVDAVRYKELLPENKPTGPVPGGSLAVTNQVAKKTGLIGVKFVEDKRYGPSGEKFEGTNIIGKVIDLDKLKDVKEGETVYVLEVGR